MSRRIYAKNMKTRPKTRSAPQQESMCQQRKAKGIKDANEDDLSYSITACVSRMTESHMEVGSNTAAGYSEGCHGDEAKWR